jgi:hypothetical protein
MALPPNIVISSEKDLWSLLEALRTGESAVGSSVHIEGWRPELLYFPDEPLGHSVSPSTARAIVEFHRSLQRASQESPHFERR